MICPVCKGTDFVPFDKYPAYLVCQGCGLYSQENPSDKVYEGPEENYGQGPGTGHLMSDDDKSKNKLLADDLYISFHPRNVLDIGSKYPYFLSTLKDRCTVLGIDGIEDIIRYGQELGVPTLRMDIEKEDLKESSFDLIIMVHLIEHLYSPNETLKRVLGYLSDRGALFVRTPDPEVPGIERDLTEHHLKIHPHLFTRKSLDFLLGPLGYEIFRHDCWEGYGQSDYYIHKNKRQDLSISLCMIVKNEEKNIEDCLNSIKDYVDEIIVVDTGSEDKTKEVVGKYTDKVYDFKWVDDFSAARNFSLSKATCQNVLWADADDIFKNPERIKETLRQGYDAYNFNVIYGNDVFCHARLFRNFCGVHFNGRVHEYPVLHWLPFNRKTDLDVIHKTSKHVSENRTLRNIRILRKESQEEPNNARTLFYLANSLKEIGNFEEAINIYHRYLALASWQDERFMAQKYIGQIRMNQKRYKEAIEELLKAVAIDDRWAEAYYYIGESYFFIGRLDMCISWMTLASSIPVPDSPLFKEMAVYRDLPYRYLFACYETKGDFVKAQKNCQKALEKKPEDAWLLERLTYFKAKASKGLIIECYRQGALGDCLMTTAALRGLRKCYPGCFIRYIAHPSSFSILEGNKYIDELTSQGKEADLKVFFAYPNKDCPIGDEGYPNKPLLRHLIRIFNECAGLPNNSMEMECTLGSVDLDFGEDLQVKYGDYVSLHIQAGWSPYKEWYDDRWEQIVNSLTGMGINTLQIGAKTDRLLKSTIDMRGLPIKRSISVIMHAELHLGVDSFSNHAANAVGTPAVILYGSTSPIGSGYNSSTNISRWCECSPCYREYEWAQDPKGPCPYDKKCMSEISVEVVWDKVKEILSASRTI